MMEANVSVVTDLDNFIEFLYGGLEGYVYLAAKKPGSKDPKDWIQEFVAYPQDTTKLKSIIRQATQKFDIYIAPAIFKEPTNGQKENVKATNVVWADFDGNAPQWDNPDTQPSLVIRSSLESHQHAYWRLDTPLTSIEEIESINRRITYNYGADGSGWDACQVLRPPETRNHKRGEDVRLLSFSNTSYDLAVFDSFAPVAAAPDPGSWELGSLPDVQDVILKHAFPPDLVLVLKKERDEVADRSASLMNLAFGCCELGLKDNEIFVLLKLCADRWDKFPKNTRAKQLARVISKARVKYPENVSNDEPEDEEFALAFGYQTFLDTEIEIDWAIEPLLMDNGSMLMVGPSGIGKTQFSLWFMIHLALGKDFLHYKIPKAKKILFVSLEMGHAELQVFLNLMDKTLTDEERAILEENLIIIPHGEPWPLNTSEGQSLLLQVIEQVEPGGVFIDSVGSSLMGNISSDEVVQPLIAFNDRIRKKYGLFVWYIHHTRKSQQNSTAPISQDDIYGNQYLLNRSTNSYGILRGKDGLIKVRNFKTRLHAKEEDYLLKRGDNLEFTKVNTEIDNKLVQQLANIVKGEDPPPVGTGGFQL